MTTTQLSVEEALGAVTRVLEDLQGAHIALSERAARMEEELDRKVTELDRAHTRLEAVLSALPTGVVVRDAEGRVERANHAALDILGLEAAAVLGADALASDDLEADENHRLERPDGRTCVVAVRRADLEDTDGRGFGRVEILDDRTALARVTQRLHQQSKMAALGTMAGGIAHEIRNPMNAIRGFAGLLERELTTGTADLERAARWAGSIVEGSREVDAIISATLTLAHPEQMADERFDARRLAADALELVRQDLVAEGLTAVELSSDVPALELSGDRLKLRQALRNLITNAAQAQPGGGRVHLSLTREGERAVFTVADAGPGIPHELVERVREPFFTTRAEGTGLGLALVHTIAGLHGGELEVSSRPSFLGGAAVRLLLPTLS